MSSLSTYKQSLLPFINTWNFTK